MTLLSNAGAVGTETKARAPREPDVDPLSTLVEILAFSRKRTPQAVALDDGIRSLTYEGLAAEAEALAARLRALGVGRGDRVGLQMASGSVDLYLSIVGILLSGAAYVPVDHSDPSERAEQIWTDAAVACVIFDGMRIDLRRTPTGTADAPQPDDDCWVIFTSGSTGTPKAVAVTHRAAAAFVNAEAELWTVRADDRVLASLSPSFDASCEEMWLAWRNGAALVPCPRAVVQSVVDLGPWLEEHAVTVISTVPTLAAAWKERDLARVHLIILGGEICPAELGWRLAHGREVWNTYGPTEATVVTTAARIVPGHPITIGAPLAGWEVAVVDHEAEPVRYGEIGELVIGGVGLGRYLDASLDAKRFAPFPRLGWSRAYRSGDRVRQTPDGLVFVGRDDDQIKISGRRIELGEIDALLSAIPGVRAGAAAVRYSAAKNAILVGYVVGDVDLMAVHDEVVRHLPSGIVPLIVGLDALPLKSSGKVDRSALPWPPTVPTHSDNSIGAEDVTPERPLTESERWLADAWEFQLGPRTITPSSNFFDLGGTSIAAAKLVSRLRAHFPSTAVADVYEFRTLEDMAARLKSLVPPALLEDPEPVTRHRWGAIQLLGVVALVALGSVQWLIGILAYNQWFGTGMRVGWLAIAAGWILFTSAPGRAGIVIGARRILLPHLRPGHYPRQGWLSMRIWFVERLTAMLHLDLLAGTPWTPRYARMNGVRVGEGARLATLPSPTGILRIGAGATFEGDVDARSWWIDGHELILGEIVVGADARIGTRCVLMPGAVIGDGAEIEPGSVVTGVVPAGERWSGSPARCVGLAGETWPDAKPVDVPRPRFARALFSFGIFSLSAIPLIAALPELAILHIFGDLSSAHGVVSAVLVDAPMFAACYLISYAITVAIALRATTWLIRPGWHVDTGPTAWAMWFSEAALARARDVLFPLYASVYTRSWLRMIGITVGRRTEVSTGVGLNRLTKIGETSFVADDVVFAGNRSRGGRIEVAPIAVGSGTFLGNGALLMPGTRLGDGSLVGILSTPPATSLDGTSWLGLPPLELPRIAEKGDPARTTTPPRRLVLARGGFEIVRIVLPSTISLLLGILSFSLIERGATDFGAVGLLLAPVVLGVAALAAVTLTIAAKWIVMGRYQAGDHPIWSFFVWRDELINTLQEQLAGAWLLERAVASPIISVYLRAMGATVARGVWLECLNVTEFDLVTLEEGCSVNRGACIDTHLVHDRILRMGPATLGRDSTLGPESAVLPDTTLGAGCTVGARSVVMRGESLPPHTRWHGIPVRSE